ncbi:acyltransferase family protein [Legionella gresilensis]|uniref:acyltransferase family protein n=1 Tax=Legionella gresilensis TaxID=91823 RepID=UPI00104116AF|nr:acyltransferase family protein [Legionella gresilensis]
MSDQQINFSRPGYRPDIDGLRAVAVLSVVAFHAFPNRLKGGFIGVDIFFVISGYLISTIIFQNLDRGTFSFKEFYIRRVKRIFPALILVLISCFVFGWLVLLPDETKQLGKHMIGSASFIQNIILWNEAGYFDNAAETKPLLHIWSLGVEEQFYFIWPLLIWLSWKCRFNLLLVTLFVALVSFALNIKGINEDAIAVFYSPQTRFWELLSGGLFAWINLYGCHRQIWKLKIDKSLPKVVNRDWSEGATIALANFFSTCGFILLCYGFWRINKDLSFPGNWAIIPVLSAVLIISSGPNAWINRTILSNRVAVWFGLISFPLYLWHWPLLSFMRIIESENPGWLIRIVLVLIAIALAWLTYRLVEYPIRIGRTKWIKASSLMLLMLGVSYLGYNDYIVSKFGSRFPNNESKQDLENQNLVYAQAFENCKRLFPEWRTLTDNPCLLQQAAHNSIAIIGDSKAGQLFGGVSKYLAPNYSLAVFAASCAAPFINVSTGVVNGLENNVVKIRKDAYKLINRAYDYIINDPDIKVVVMAHNPFCSYNASTDIANPNNNDYRDVLREGMKRTFSALVKAGKQVIVLFDNPTINFDPKICQWRPFRVTKSNNCSFPVTYFNENPVIKNYRSLVEDVLKDYPQVKTFDLAEFLCDKENCHIVKNGHVLYSDVTHLNNYGSEYIASYLSAVIMREVSVSEKINA